MNDLVLDQAERCNPDACPLSERCPIGPIPDLPCGIKKGFIDTVSRDISVVFPDMDKKPMSKLKVQYFMVPLFEQLLHVKMAVDANPRVLMGKRVNPLLRETRQIIQAIIQVMDSTEKEVKDKIKEMESSKGGNRYYDMLFTEGTSSVEHPVGFPQDN